MRNEYANWRVAQGYNENTTNTQTSHIRQIAKYFGELGDLIFAGKLDKLVDKRTFSLEDERSGRAIPTRASLNGRTRAAALAIPNLSLFKNNNSSTFEPRG